MAKYRYVAREVIESERFKNMPILTQTLYFLLVIGADDNGKIPELWDLVGETDITHAALDTLVENGLVVFEPRGVSVVHWRGRRKRNICRQKNGGM